jgi:hypothetical protein
LACCEDWQSSRDRELPSFCGALGMKGGMSPLESFDCESETASSAAAAFTVLSDLEDADMSADERRGQVEQFRGFTQQGSEQTQ